MKLTPETLRKRPPLSDDEGVDITNLWAHCDAHADAWERLERYSKTLEDSIGTLQARIEELERLRMLAISQWGTWKDVLLSSMDEADWEETMTALKEVKK